ANNAIQDADLLTKELINSENKDLIECIRRYNEQMRVRSSKDVLTSRSMALRQRKPVGDFGLILRYFFFKVLAVFFYVSVFIKVHT
ncbi:448_t:CDS:1, partial [Scutellospora calospora]